MFSCLAFSSVFISRNDVIGKPSFSFSIFNRFNATISSVTHVLISTYLRVSKTTVSTANLSNKFEQKHPIARSQKHIIVTFVVNRLAALTDRRYVYSLSTVQNFRVNTWIALGKQYIKAIVCLGSVGWRATGVRRSPIWVCVCARPLHILSERNSSIRAFPTPGLAQLV